MVVDQHHSHPVRDGFTRVQPQHVQREESLRQNLETLNG